MRFFSRFGQRSFWVNSLSTFRRALVQNIDEKNITTLVGFLIIYSLHMLAPFVLQDERGEKTHGFHIHICRGLWLAQFWQFLCVQQLIMHVVNYAKAFNLTHSSWRVLCEMTGYWEIFEFHANFYCFIISCTIRMHLTPKGKKIYVLN